MDRQSTLFNMKKREDNTDRVLKDLKETKPMQQTITVNSASKLEATIQAARKLLQDKEGGRLVTDKKDIDDYLEKILLNGIVAIDTESTGLNPIQDQIVGLCLYTPGEEGIYIPILHRSHMTGIIKDGQVSKEVIKDLLEKIETNKVKQIYHNYKFDARMIYNNFDIWVSPYWDTLLCGIILNENEPHGLKALYNKYITKSKGENLSYDALFENFDFSMIPIDIAYKYAANDAKMTYELYKFQENVLNRDKLAGLKNTFMNIEMPLVPIVAEMEETGNCIDMEYTKYLEEKYTKLLDEAMEVVRKEVDKYSDKIKEFRQKRPDLALKLENPINIASPTQLAILLYDIIKVGTIDKKKPRGTGKEILNNIDLPLAKAILDYRTIEKLMNTYILKLPKCVERKTGRLHGSFNQGGTDTGRFSSSNPNLQNIPSKNKDIRKMFVAPKGYVMVGSDFSYLTSWLN